jgi:hypothetical protein
MAMSTSPIARTRHRGLTSPQTSGRIIEARFGLAFFSSDFGLLENRKGPIPTDQHSR